MKKLVEINVVCNGSTGKIMCDIAKEAKNNDIDTYCFYGRGKPNNNVKCIRVGNKLSIYFHVLLARLGFNCFGSYFTTKRMIKRIKKINPDIIHLHNIHGYYVNIKVLFKYLKNEYKGKIIWTLHDCWAFTGHCSYFSYINCNKWQDYCFNCPQLRCYPKEYIDTTKREFKLKKELFTELNNLTIITPSFWLEDIVKKSFLNEYEIKTIHNGINLETFKPKKDSEVLKKYNISNDKKILLGVANIWEERKGLNIFFELEKYLKDDEIIVLVGLTNKQISKLSEKIIGIRRTDNQEEIAKIYSMSEVFINPSSEETFSLVTIEAMACGLPVVVCGISAPKELVTEEVGIVLNNRNPKDYYDAYKAISSKKLNRKNIVKYAQKFSKTKMIAENLKIYKEC